MTRVVNVRHEPYASDPSLYVYAGRPGRGQAGVLGNPFPRTDPDCLAKWEKHFYARIRNDPEYRMAVEGAAETGLPLGCFCVNKNGEGLCHAKTIARWIDESSQSLEEPRG